MLQNPSLLEHESFTDLLWAAFHLLEELEYRQDLKQLNPADAAHLAGDINRVYGLLLASWLAYMQHLHSHYKFLYSLAVRTNPFDPAACVEVK